MSEVPEHLLRRSQERRAALGQGGDAPTGAPSEGAVAPATGDSGAVRAPSTPAPVAPTPAEIVPAAPLPPYVEASLRRPKIPRWALPVLVMLPIWGYIYIGALKPAEVVIELEPELAVGQQVYNTKCATCHGATGQGGTGRPLKDGEVLLTFPDPQQHIDWVVGGSTPKGTPYGDPNRPGGQRLSQSVGVMPAFGSSLSAEQIKAVVRYEREILSGEGGAAGAPAGAPAGGGH
ncbi:MAG: c-type cytochrome [Acidimicrobiales bacterium]